jgi:tetratricopeptide (TPR) repeat protein
MAKPALSVVRKRGLLHLIFCSVLLMSFAVGNIQPVSAAADLSENVTRHVNLAKEYASAGDDYSAIEEYQIAIRLAPHAGVTASLFNNLGLCFLRIKQYPQAIASFQLAMRIQPGFEVYYTNLIKAYGEIQQMPLAKTKLYNLIDQNPFNAEAWYLLGLVYEQIEDYEAAKSCFKAYLKLQPNSRLAAAAKRHL